MAKNSDPEAPDPEARREDKSGSNTAGRGRFDVRSPAMAALFLLALFFTVYVARVILLPIVTALFLYFLLSPVIRSLKKIHVPEFVGAGLVLILLLGTVSYGVSQLYEPATEWIHKAPASLNQVERKIRNIRKSVEEVKKTAEEIEKITQVETKQTKQVTAVQIKRPSLTGILLSVTQKAFILGAITLFLLYFLLTHGSNFVRKIVVLVPGLRQKIRILRIEEEIEYQVSRYLFTVTVINACLGVAIAFAMYLLGMPNPVLWGVMAGLVNFVPYLGQLAGVSIVGLVALITFDTLGEALPAPAVYLLIVAIEGQVITPAVLGRRFALNPVVIYVWLIFWGWMWGIVGAFLAVPMLTVFKIFCDHIPGLAPLGSLIGK